MKIFNTASKAKEEFTPLSQGKVTMYTCGPTVYGRPHIGNYSSFLMADLFRRWCDVNGLVVTHVKNITDVGHLVVDDTADASGEDKVEKEAKRIAKEERGENATVGMDDVLAVAENYTKQYLADEEALNILPAHERPRATETIAEMIAMIEKLIERGHAYEAEDAVYYSVESFPDYGKLSGNTLTKRDKLQAGVRIDLSQTKKHPADFALWIKRIGDKANHVLHWESPWGDGFPGWHIECSAMSTKFLGESIDVHTGGEDNIFPHHECEIAQSEGASGKPFVRYWLHKRRVNFGDEKMSKSLGNVLSLDDITEKGFSPLDLRFFFLSTQYRSHTKFIWKGLEDAKKVRLRVGEWMRDVQEGVDGTDEVEESILKKIQAFDEEFRTAMDDDLNTPAAIAVISEVIAWSRQLENASVMGSDVLKAFCVMIEHTFGCFKLDDVEVPTEILQLANDRDEARKVGDYKKADELRDAIITRGFVLEDKDGETIIVPAERRG